MKRKSNTYLIGILQFILVLLPIASKAQFAISVKDTVFIVVCKGSLENSQPIVSYLVVKDLSRLAELATINNEDSFMCRLFTNSILFEEPFFTISNNKGLYGFDSPKKEKAFLSKLSKKIDKLNNNYTHFTTRRFENGKNIEVSITKTVAEFWSISKKVEEINTYSHSFQVKSGCYEKGYIYNLKDVITICKLHEKEVDQIKRNIE